jgi:predicted alpha/beta superfamily hydrolase
MLRFLCRNHKAFFLQVFLLFCFHFSFSQFKARLHIIGVPTAHLQDSFFVAGNFTGWDPAKYGTLFSKKDGGCFIELNNLPAGAYQFKFTRGNWHSVEVKADGKDIENRLLLLSSDTIIDVLIDGWQDDFATVIKPHTASENVHIIDTAFEIPQLATTRRIWLYLPPGYENNKKHYPVIYMQDGQNIFDEYTAGYGEWGVDECVDSMIKTGKPACIIVGIDNGPKRLYEYNPYDYKDVGNGEGEAYVDFIVKNLKPFIDKHYRTLPTNENTIIAGSSMGGLISYYAMLKYPGVFGKGGIFSPSFWAADEIKNLTDSEGKNLKGTLFFYMGLQEGEQYVTDMEVIIEKLSKNSSALMYTVTDPKSGHNEKAWRKWFPEFYNWVIANGFNNEIKLEKEY